MKNILFTLLLAIVAHNTNAQIITTIAGTGVAGFSGDGGNATAARLDNPTWIAIDGHNNIYIADYSNHRIRKISPVGIISTIAGTGSSGYSGDGGPAISAQLNYPMGLAIDGGGNVIFADASNRRIRKINPSGIISTIAGNGSTGGGGDGGAATLAQLYFPTSVAVDDSGNIFIADYSNNNVRKINAAGIITRFAGNGTPGYSGDYGPASSARLSMPYGITAHNGDVYFAEYGNHVVRKVDHSNIITTIAGTGTGGFNGDGLLATATQFNKPQGIVFDNIGNAYVNDVNNHRTRKINASGIVYTIAGNGIGGYSGDGGLAVDAKLYSPAAFAFDSSHNIYLPDWEEHVVRKVQNTPDYTSDSATIYVAKQCNGPEITIIPNNYYAGQSVKTFFGDGSSDSANISSLGYLSINHTYANSGIYTVKHLLFHAGILSDSFKYSYSNITCRSLAVKYYYDGNNNCSKDPTENFISQQILIEIDSNSVSIDTIPVTSGLYYTAYGPIGAVYAFKIISAPPGLSVSCPTGIVYDTINSSVVHPTKYIGLSCNTAAAFDISVNAITTATGVSDQYGVIYIQNSYCTAVPATITLHCNPLYDGTPHDVSPAYTSHIGNTTIWDIASLPSTMSAPFSIHYSVWHSTTLLSPGDTVRSYYSVTPTSGDVDIVNNNQVILDTVKGGCDPNEMKVDPPGCVMSGTTPAQLKYTIHFENTGNDTAHNIYVLDTLPDQVDISSMRIVMSSNEMYIYRDKDAAGHNILKFDFPSINLLDSSHHGQCDGAVIFTIQTKTGLANGTHIDNRAGIYFDINDVVMTNTVENNTGCPTTDVSLTAEPATILLFPNPADAQLYISSNEKISSLVITNRIGQLMGKYEYDAKSVSLDVSSFIPGVYFIKVNDLLVQKFIKL